MAPCLIHLVEVFDETLESGLCDVGTTYLDAIILSPKDRSNKICTIIVFKPRSLPTYTTWNFYL